MTNNILCDLFGHKFNYHISITNKEVHFRVCKRCLKLQEYKDFGFATDWVNLIQLTKKEVSKRGFPI